MSISYVGRDIVPPPIAQSSLRKTHPSNDVTKKAQFPGTVTVNVRPVLSYTRLPGFHPTVAIPPAQDLPTMTPNSAPLVPVSSTSHSPQAESSGLLNFLLL